MNPREKRIIQDNIRVISSLVKGELPLKIESVDHHSISIEIRELTCALNKFIEIYTEANDYICEISKGNLEIDPPLKNFFVSPAKQLHANLKHLKWQTHQIARGDYNQHVDFLGDFSESFNAMIDALKEKKNVEAESRRLENQLQKAKRMESIGVLAGGVAHDLNNILSGLVSYPELILLDLTEGDPLRGPILTIKKSGEKAAAIVQDLLTLAMRNVDVSTVINVNDIISEYLNSPEHKKLTLRYSDIQVKTHFDADLLNILGSPIHLSKMIMNLVSNAADAIPADGDIIISTENRYIDKRVHGYDDIEEGDYVFISVSDTGSGITAEDMGRIFEPFYSKKVMGRSGSGLGMAVVWGTVKDHKGYIDVESVEGNGTTVSLYFPVTRKAPANDESVLSIEDYMGQGESILIVDDIEDQRVIGSIMLMKLGYSVSSVSSGEEAIEYMKSNSVNLLVLDMIMDPGIDGLETYKRILQWHPGQKAIIASGYSETDSVKEAQRLGAGEYLKKPYSLEKLGLAVRNALDGE